MNPEFIHCAHCDCLMTTRRLTTRADGAHICVDGDWCIRAKRIRIEVLAEFEALQPVPIDRVETKIIADKAFNTAWQRENREHVNSKQRAARELKRGGRAAHCVMCRASLAGLKVEARVCSKRCRDRQYREKRRLANG